MAYDAESQIVCVLASHNNKCENADPLRLGNNCVFDIVNVVAFATLMDNLDVVLGSFVNDTKWCDNADRLRFRKSWTIIS